jgi:hypothetical protein
MRLYNAKLLDFEYHYGIIPTIKLGSFKGDSDTNYCRLVPVIYSDKGVDKPRNYDYFLAKGKNGRKIKAINVNVKKPDPERGALLVLYDVKSLNLNESTHKKLYIDMSGTKRNGLVKDLLIKIKYSVEPIIVDVNFFCMEEPARFVFVKGEKLHKEEVDKLYGN